MARNSINDDDRAQWVANDEGLYLLAREWMRSNRGGVRGFIRANRADIDTVIRRVRDGVRPAHYLAYGR